jgi:hypothetical protein
VEKIGDAILVALHIHDSRVLLYVSPSALADVVFSSEFTLVLYLLPALFAGTGVNMVSHVMIHNLADAERRFDAERGELRGVSTR